MVDTLYHYSSNQGCFGILDSHQIWMTDIRKSNDDNEMLIMYPDLLSEIINQYRNEPFPFKYKGKTDIDGIVELVTATEDFIDLELNHGDFTNFVVCFSEKADLLSQWRGYANDGKGCCIGFSYDQLEKYCKKYDGALRLERVKYITKKEQMDIVEKQVKDILLKLRELRPSIVDHITRDDESDTTDACMLYHFCKVIKRVLIDSLIYKYDGFSEEKEWRLCLRDNADKVPSWIIGNDEVLCENLEIPKTIQFLKNKIKFDIKQNNILAYRPACFDEFEAMPITEIWTGPKNRITDADLKLYLAQKGYPNVDIKSSMISYR